MQEVTSPEKTIEIFWKSRVIRYISRSNQIITIDFPKPNKGGIDRFRICCGIGIIQKFYTNQSRLTTWTGVGDELLKHCEQLFGKQIKHRSMDTYWTHFKKGQEDAYRKYTRFCINGTSIDKLQATLEEKTSKIKDCGEEFFSIIKGYVLGPYESLENGQYKLLGIEFKDMDDNYYRLERLIHSFVIPEKISQRTHTERMPRTAKRLKGSGYELQDLLDIAEESAFVVGQNLVTLVSDEIPGSQNKPVQNGHFRKAILDWLLKKPGRRVEMLILDPTSKTAVIEMAKTFDEKFIPDLCNAIERFQLWQKNIDKTKLQIRVAPRVPLSFVATDADLKDPKSSLMVMTPLAFEKRSGERQPIVLRRELDQIAFDGYYKPYHKLFLSSSTKNILKVSGNDLKQCRMWEGELHRQKRGNKEQK